MTLEGAVAITAGIVAGSVALIGFGLDSVIEGFASVVIIWRFTGARVLCEAAETRAQKLVAIQFFVLAPYVGFESIRALLGREHPDTSWVGIALAASSVVVMPYLGIAKQRLADALGSAATKGEGARTCCAPTSRARCSPGCSATRSSARGGSTRSSACSSPGSPLRKGEAWRGDGCCAASPVPRERATCVDGCC